MKEIQRYEDWRKEVEIWEEMNTALKVDKKVQAGFLFESLNGTPQQIVLSELSVSEIITENGVQNMIDTLDQFLLRSKTTKAFKAIDDLIHFKCNEASSLQSFIMEFQIKVNRVQATGTVLSEGILGYMLLNAVNLPENKTDLIKATCEELTFKNVKTQLNKVGLTKSQVKNLSSSMQDKPQNSKMNYQNCTYSEVIPFYHSCMKNSYGNSKQSFEEEKLSVHLRKRPSCLDQITNKKPRMNPTNHFGYVKACSFCKCLYHYIDDCPYAVDRTKMKVMNEKNSYNISEMLDTTKSNHCNVALYTSSSDPAQLNYEAIGHAVIDIGCPRSVAGEEWLSTYVSSLSRKDRSSIQKKKTTNKICFGDGVLHNVEYCVRVPIYIGQLRYLLSVDIVKCSIPLLMSRHALHQAKIDVEMGTMCFLGTTVPLVTSSTGHLCVQISRSLNPSNQETQKVLSRVLFQEQGNAGKLNTKHKAHRLHLQFCHPSAEDLISLLKKTKMEDNKLFDAIKKVTIQCNVCLKNRNFNSTVNVKPPPESCINEDVFETADEDDYYSSDECVTANRPNEECGNIKQSRMFSDRRNPEENRQCNNTFYDSCKKRDVLILKRNKIPDSYG